MKVYRVEDHADLQPADEDEDDATCSPGDCEYGTPHSCSIHGCQFGGLQA